MAARELALVDEPATGAGPHLAHLLVKPAPVARDVVGGRAREPRQPENRNDCCSWEMGSVSGELRITAPPAPGTMPKSSVIPLRRVGVNPK